MSPVRNLALSTPPQLLLSQGREAEAAQYTGQLQARRDRDPYYWLGLGLDALQQADTRKPSLHWSVLRR